MISSSATSAGHGRGGPLPVYRAPPEKWGPIDRGLRDAALASGYPWCADLNGPDGEGVACYPINSRDSRRITTNEAYLEPARGRANLEIRGHALVDRLLIRDGRATGVLVHIEGQGSSEISAREIVLCAGAIHSPAILLRSGIGPADELKAMGIAVERDLPVGKHFFDHPLFRATIKLREEFQPTDPDTRHTNCCVTYSSGLADGGKRDMILIAFNHRGIGNPGAIGAGLFNAYSRGHLKLASTDASIDPIVEENMLADDRDLLRMVDAVKRLAVLTTQPALADISRVDSPDRHRPDAAAGRGAAERGTRSAAPPRHRRHSACRRFLPHGGLQRRQWRGESGWHREGHRRAARGGRFDHAVRLPRQHPFHHGGDW